MFRNTQVNDMQIAYTAIGQAVVAAQILETALVPIFAFFRMKTEPGYLEKTGGFVPVGAFKVPIASIVKTLAERGSIAPDLEDRLTKYVADRHSLIHRWVLEHGWPAEGDIAEFAPILELANRVKQEASQLTTMLASHMVKYADPDWAKENMPEYEERMAQLFQRAHVDEAS